MTLISVYIYIYIIFPLNPIIPIKWTIESLNPPVRPSKWQLFCHVLRDEASAGAGPPGQHLQRVKGRKGPACEEQNFKLKRLNNQIIWLCINCYLAK